MLLFGETQHTLRFRDRRVLPGETQHTLRFRDRRVLPGETQHTLRFGKEGSFPGTHSTHWGSGTEGSFPGRHSTHWGVEKYCCKEVSVAVFLAYVTTARVPSNTSYRCAQEDGGQHEDTDALLSGSSSPHAPVRVPNPVS
uniref:Uncharacterized protein n=1 Tax=Molossus molossus TaxID=27622 RepID=A0A7J8I211_MOLMO|nr:hypothetical protein HJG59_010884 [Molossus molossus]